MRRRNVTISLLLILAPLATLRAQSYYVSPTGDDANPGTFESPFRTIARGITAATVPGAIVVVRGGTYPITATISISRSGTSAAPFRLWAYPGERPLVDGSGMALGLRAFNLSGSHWHVRGLDVYKAGDNGMRVTGSNNLIDNCAFFENFDTGLQLDNGAANNLVVNCDSYFNADPSQGNADGFAAKLGVGSGNRFEGCRAWQNSDDGWDGYLRGANDVSTTLDNCWVFHNGYLKTGLPSSGNGNGFKLGGSDNRDLLHNVTVTRSLAVDNRVKGYDQNNNRGSMVLLNCTAWRNGTNYAIDLPLAAGESLLVKNCVALGNYGALATFAIQQTNSWLPPFVAAENDFVTIDTSGLRGPRTPEGALPVLGFLRLASGSDLIDAGTPVGLPFFGTAPDLGCFETAPMSVDGTSESPGSYHLAQNYPNPFNPATVIDYRLPLRSEVSLRLYDLLGREVRTIVDGVEGPGHHSVRLNADGLSSGVYIFLLRATPVAGGGVSAGPYVASRRLLLVR
jgi:hypothetical protein